MFGAFTTPPNECLPLKNQASQPRLLRLRRCGKMEPPGVLPRMADFVFPMCSPLTFLGAKRFFAMEKMFSLRKKTQKQEKPLGKRGHQLTEQTTIGKTGHRTSQTAVRYLCAGELLPAVFHVSARALARQSLSIFCDHSDVMAASWRP